YASKDRVRYRYYTSAPCIRGPTDEPLGSVTRVPASDIEAVIAHAVIAHTNIAGPTSAGSILSLSREALETAVSKIEVRKNQLAVHLKDSGANCDNEHGDGDADADRRLPPQASAKRIVLIPWKKPSPPSREILLPANMPEHRARPMKAERRSTLIRSIGRGRLWLQEIIDGRETIETLAAQERCSIRQINMTISLAFLAPTLVKAAVEGRFPRGIGVAALRDAPAEWSRQMERLGLAPENAPETLRR
ncbi:MAG: recombinase family protein, partial [Nitrobacter sp.]